MAYSSAGLYQVGPGGNSPRKWIYSTTDLIKAVVATDYFSDGDIFGLTANDIITVVNTTNGVTNELMVTAVTAGGAATAGESNKSYELTASGAIIAGVSSVELNHATVAVVSTMADSTDHQGLFIVKDTSASGTAAHTFTVTVGTVDGTNNVLTFNAPNEAVAIWFDSAGDGTILENVGSVVIS
jgi:hypothetical protein